MEVSTDFIESEKGRFGLNLPPSERIQPENFFPFTSVQWTLSAAETSDRRKSRNKKTKEKQHTVSRILPVRMLFRYPIGGIFF